MVRIGAITALAGVITATASAQDGIQVFAPSAGASLISDRVYTVEWTGNAANSFVSIDLYYCADGCGEDECGSWVTSLCPYSDRGCPDSEGDYDIVMPDPMAGTSGGTYKVGVSFINDDDSRSCSGGFQLFADEDVPVDPRAGLTVVSPEAGDMAYTGEEYTILFDYFDELGSRVGRFNIDLYEDDGEGACGGEPVAALCDKPEVGCKDTQGDYDIVMADVPSGQYQIRISPFSNPSVYGCSGVFDVVSEGDESFSFSYNYQ